MENTVESNVNVNAAATTSDISIEAPVTTDTTSVMNNAIQKSLSIIPNSSVKPDPLGLVILGFGVIGVGATGYAAYKGIKWIVNKVKSNAVKEAATAEEVKEPAKEEAAE